MKLLIRPVQVLYSIYAFAVFLVLMFALLPFIVIASLFGRMRGGNVIYIICRFWSRTCLLLWGIHHRNYFEAPHFAKHPCIFVFNHISYLDIPILMCAFRYQHIRVLGKAEIGKVPVFGFIYKNAVVSVRRASMADRARSVQVLKSVLTKNISVVIAPEGTFNMTGEPLKDFYDGAFRIAIETKTPIKPVIFLDAFDRLHHRSLFSMTPGRSRAIYLEEINVQAYSMQDVAELKQKVFNQMSDALKRHNASWIENGK